MAEGNGHVNSTRNPGFAAGRGEHGPADVDIVRRGLINAADAERLLTRYNTEMVYHLPLVFISPDLSAKNLQERRPMVFFAVMAAASYDAPALQRKLVQELTRTYADKIMVAAEKNLDLIQALQISIAWLWMPDHYEELQLYQLVHMSTAMAIDLGLGRHLPEKRITPFRQHAFRQRKEEAQAANSTDATTLEARRAWLACYYLTSTTAVMMRRPLLLTWTRFMAESCEILRNAPDRAPTDEYLCAFVWAHRLAEDVAQQIAGDDCDDPANASRMAFSLKKADRDLDQFQKSLPNVILRSSGSLAITLGAIPLYLHGAALYCEFVDGKQKEPRISQTSSLPVSPGSHTLPDAIAVSAANISTISRCLLNVRTVMETFMAMGASTIRSLPTLNLGRVTLAGAMLLKIYVFVDQDPELAAAIDKQELAVVPCIDGLIRQFHKAGADQCCRPAIRLIAVLCAIKDAFITYCGRQEPDDRHSTMVHTSSSSQRFQDQTAPVSRQTWPLQQPREGQRQQSVAQGVPGYVDSTASARPDVSCAPMDASVGGTRLPPWDINFFAALSVEEFAYSLGVTASGEGLADYYPMSLNELGPNMSMG
ncbi:hypothetical protein ACHAQH_006762 [Verticillium albo-atrum]